MPGKGHQSLKKVDSTQLMSVSVKKLSSTPKLVELQKSDEQASIVRDPIADLNDVCWNPLDGPFFCKKSRTAMKYKQEFEKNSTTTPQKTLSHDQNHTITPPSEKLVNSALDKTKPLASKLPWFDHLFTSDHNFLPLLGFFPLTDLGFLSDADESTMLKKKVVCCYALKSYVDVFNVNDVSFFSGFRQFHSEKL